MIPRRPFRDSDLIANPHELGRQASGLRGLAAEAHAAGEDDQTHRWEVEGDRLQDFAEQCWLHKNVERVPAEPDRSADREGER